MNFLAHLYLSKNNPNIIIGNFIADYIKGNKFNHFHTEIQKGIILHRNIDTFTDTHPIVKKSKRRLHERYRHYDGVIIDVFFDHFLAKNWSLYSEIPLQVYINSIHKLLQKHLDILPEKTQKILPFLIKHNWLFNYQFISGIEEVLIGINKRTNGISKMHLAIEDLKLHYQNFEEDFTWFFSDLQSFVTHFYTENLKLS